MSRRFDRFLSHRPVSSSTTQLGRVFNVTRESWKLTDDPTKVRPRRERLITGRTASEAADFARLTAETFDEHGFHKPSGAWWASDGAIFHRYIIDAGRRGPPTAVLLASSLAGAALAVLHLSRRRPRGLS